MENSVLKWQSNSKNRHRVRFFTSQVYFTESINLSTKELFWDAAKSFKETDIYSWVEENGVKLHWAEDDNSISWCKQVIFYGDLTEKQFVDYALRFC